MPHYLAGHFLRQLRSALLELRLPGPLGAGWIVSPRCGVLQGHPSSPLVFNAVLADVLRPLQPLFDTHGFDYGGG